MNAVLVVNAGSSSVKFQVFDVAAADKLRRLVKGQVESIGTQPRLRAETGDGSTLVDRRYAPNEIGDVAAAIGAAGDWLRDTQAIELAAVGHRVVHGGPDYDRPVLIDRDVLTRLERYIPLAPLHQPNNLAPIRALLASRPDLVQVACFDSGFHRSHDTVTDHYAIPEHFYHEGVRRYGFHGLSYEYVAGRLCEIAPSVANRRVIIAHLGSGASLCALAAGKSVESTMGFTALDGLPMGTRSGQIDPGVLLYMLSKEGMSPEAVQNLLYRESGLKGLSGVSNDMRELEASGDAGAALAIDHFVHRIRLYAGMLAAALGGLDAFVFTAGIGENSAMIRARVAEKLAWLGAVFDPVANRAAKTVISQPESKVALYIVPTDEELMIARHTSLLLAAPGGQVHPGDRLPAKQWAGSKNGPHHPNAD
jgi:acetate kinase